MNFGRQPLPVTVTLDGATEDVWYWMSELMRRAEFKGDLAECTTQPGQFVIYPRAIND